MKAEPIISHLYLATDGKWCIQSNDDHAAGTAELASAFASEFGMSPWGNMLGLVHDRGKERHGFQAHIKASSGYDKSARSSDGSNHSLTGAVLVHRLKEDCLYWLSNAIAGHHRGLYDIDELEYAVSEKIPENVNSELPSIELSIPKIKPSPEEASHLVRMLFSCLVDADRLDTERFMNLSLYELRRNSTSIADLKHKLDLYSAKLKAGKTNDLNSLRSEIQDMCDRKGAEAPGFFSLTVPTGGGKTLASIIWALSHALQHNKHRIIIAIPFTSIIVQTAQTLREIFGPENVLEHHSAVDETEADDRLRLASENWDAPIVVTTNVQLFESMFSNKPSRCRKLHSLCNSVVILDEVQSLPLSYLQPIIDAMRSYVKLFGVSFLFCTASQPVLEGERRGAGTAVFRGVKAGEINHIVDPSMNLHDRLRRVTIRIDQTPVSINELGERVVEHDRVLCVVNTRRYAAELYKALSMDGTPTFHLSRMMCPAHILDILNQVKKILRDPTHKVRVISTQLIEAGVDIDFPVVFRQFAGLDSILQAAGRCNREGRQKSGVTQVFIIEKDRPYGSIGFASDAMRRLLSLKPDGDWFDPATMETYYKMLYANTPTFDRNDITGKLASPRSCQYETAAEEFHLIDDDGVSVIVNYEEAKDLVNRLRLFGPSRKLSRELGRYCVSIHRRTFERMRREGLVEEPYAGFYYAPSATQYDDATGLNTENEYLEQTIIL